MILRRIFVIAFALFTVTLNTACPHDIASQAAEESTLRTEYNDKTDQANDISRDLAKSHQIYIGPGNAPLLQIIWGTVTTAERAYDRAKLQKYLELVGRCIEISKHKAMEKNVTSSQKNLLVDNQESAQNYLNSLNQYEGK